MSRQIELGSGLIAIGRQWGTTPQVPSEAQALGFLEAAFSAGIRYFDTAPSYGLSELRLGKFLAGLTNGERSQITVATKCGEHWDPEKQEAYTDHSQSALEHSIDRSLERLAGHVSILQLHKTSVPVLESVAFESALAYAEVQGITTFGASVSDVETAQAAIGYEQLSLIQLPYNQGSPQFHDSIAQATARGLQVVTNRPFQMGAVTAPGAREDSAVRAFRFVLQAQFAGAVLTGTSNADHLRENIAAFNTAHEQMQAHHAQ